MREPEIRGNVQENQVVLFNNISARNTLDSDLTREESASNASSPGLITDLDLSQSTQSLRNIVGDGERSSPTEGETFFDAEDVEECSEEGDDGDLESVEDDENSSVD